MSLAIDNLRESFKTIGYNDRSMIKDYRYKSKKIKINIDIVLFSDSNKKDLDTSCIAVCKKQKNIQVKEYLDVFYLMGVPIGILMDEEETFFYPIKSSDRENVKFRVVKNDNVKEFIIKNRLDFNPEIIVNKNFNKQKSLFSIDYSLKQIAKQVNRELLNSTIENTFFITKERYKNVKNDKIEKALMLILTALILNDKGYLQETFIDLKSMLLQSTKLFPGYFDEEIFRDYDINLLELIYKELREDVVYDRLSEDMLGTFYEEFLITDKLRDELGIHYTPSYVSRDILERLPIEDIPVENRIVLDGTCGHGSMLLAAYDRLNSIYKDNGQSSINYLKDRIIGIDKDEVATDICKLSLLLKSLDKTNGWKIYGGRDFLTENILKYTRKKPSIIIANPPFKEDGRSRKEVASEFVNKYLEWLADDGLMGIILPATLLEKDSCEDVRRNIINKCEILEMWTLPPGTFSKAKFTSVVLLLRKRISNNDYTVLRYIKNNDLANYKITNCSSYSSFVPAKYMWKHENNNSMNLMFDYNIWNNLFVRKRIGEYFEVKNGLQVLKNQKHKAIKYEYEDGMKKWIHTSRDLDCFMINWEKEKQYIDLKCDIHRKRIHIKEKFENKKIIVNSKFNPDVFWRLYACVDTNEIFCNETFHIIYIKEGCKYEIEKLEIILNSIIANLWIYINCKKRSISPQIIKSIPVCHIEDKEYNKLKKVILKIKELKFNNEINVSEVNNLLYIMDEIIMDCYGFDELSKKKIRMFCDGYTRKGVKTNIKQTKVLKMNKIDNNVSIVTGIVEDINLEEQNINLSLNGIEDIYSLNICKDIPGWMMRNGTTFKAKIETIKDEIFRIYDFKQVGYSIFDEFDVFEDFFFSDGGEY